MTDKQWKATMAKMESLRFQIVNNIMPPDKRIELRHRLCDYAKKIILEYGVDP